MPDDHSGRRGNALVPEESEKSDGHRIFGSSYTKRPESIAIDQFDKAAKMGQRQTVIWPLLLQRAPPIVSPRQYFAV